MALPRRRRDTVYLDPVAIENADKLHKQLSAQKMLAADPSVRLSGASAFSPQEQRALRSEIKSALSQFDIEPPLDLPPVTDEERRYLSPGEQRNTQLKRALSLRGVQPLTTAPRYDLPLEQRLGVENDDLERMLRNDAGPLRAQPDAVGRLLSTALLPIAAADELAGELISPTLPAGKKITPLGIVGNIFETTQAATATVLAAETAAPKWLRAISPGLEAANTIFETIGEHTRVAQRRQIDNLRKQIEDDGVLQIFAVPADESPIVEAYRVTDYPTAIKPLISVVDPAGLLIGSLPAKQAGKLLREQKLVFDHLTGKFVKPSIAQGGFMRLPGKTPFLDEIEALAASVKPGDSLTAKELYAKYKANGGRLPADQFAQNAVQAIAGAEDQTTLRWMSVSRPGQQKDWLSWKRPSGDVAYFGGVTVKRPEPLLDQKGFLKLPFSDTPLAAKEAILAKSFDANLQERLDMAEKLRILQNVPRLMPEAGGFNFTRVHKRLDEITEAELAKLDDTVLGSARVAKVAPSLLRDLTLGESVTDAMNIVALYRNYDDWLKLAEQQHGGWFQRSWRRVYTDKQGVTKPYWRILGALQTHRFRPNTQTVARMYVHGTAQNEVRTANDRFNILKKFTAAFPSWDVKRKAFRTGTEGIPTENSPTATNYMSLLRYASAKGWLNRPIDFYLVADAFEHAGEWTVSKSGRRVFDNWNKRLDEEWAIERRMAGFKTEDPIDAVYLPHKWKNVFAHADFDELGQPVFPADPGKLRFNAKEAFTKERHFHSTRQAMTQTIIDTVKLEGTPEFENKVLQLADDIEQPTDLIISRLASGRKQVAKTLLLQDLARIGLKSGDPEHAAILGVLSGNEPVGVATRVFDEFRALLFGMDMGLMGVQVATGTVPYLVTKPKWTVETYWHALQSAMTKPDKFMTLHQERFLRAKRAGMTFAIVAKEVAGRPLVERPLGRYNPVATLNNLQFGRILPSIKLDFFEMQAELLTRDSAINKVLGRTSGLPQWEAERRAAAFVNMMFGGLNQADFLFGPGIKGLSKLALMTPQFTQSTLQTFLRAGKFGPDGALARAFFIRLFAATGALVSMNAWMSGDTDDLKQRLTDPDYPDWMTLRFGDSRVSPLARYRPLARLVFGATEDVVDRVTGDNDAVRTKTRVLDYYLGRASFPVVLGALTSTQKNFLGEPEFVQSGPTLRTKETWSVLGKGLFLPIGIGQILDDYSMHKANAGTALLSVFGISSYTLTPIREQVKKTYRETLTDVLTNATIMGRDVMDRQAAQAAAHDAVTRSRPFDVFVRDGKMLDVLTPELRTQILEQVAARRSLLKPNGDLDTNLAARLGEAEQFTAQETKAIELGMREGFFRLREAAREKRRQAYAELSAGRNEWPPRYGHDQALEILATIDADYRSALGLAGEQIEPILEKYKQKRIEPSNRQVLFEEWQNALDEAVRADGTIDWVARRRTEQMIERTLGNDERRFWTEFNDFRNQHEADFPPEKQLRDYYVQVLKPYYDVTLPMSLGGMIPDDMHDLYTAWDGARAQTEKAALWSRMTPGQQARLGPIVGAIAMRQDLLRKASVEIELALWWLYGSTPRTNSARSLITRYSRGTFDRAKATDALLGAATR